MVCTTIYQALHLFFCDPLLSIEVVRYKSNQIVYYTYSTLSEKSDEYYVFVGALLAFFIDGPQHQTNSFESVVSVCMEWDEKGSVVCLWS